MVISFIPGSSSCEYQRTYCEQDVMVYFRQNLYGPTVFLGMLLANAYVRVTVVKLLCVETALNAEKMCGVKTKKG